MVEQSAAGIGQGSQRTPRDKSDRFRIIRRLGAGGAAEVFLAVARGPGGFQKLVVLKKPHSSAGESAVPRSMVFHEARIAARLNHPNCAQVIEIEEIDGVPVIVFEYLEGLSLSALRNEAAGKVPLPVELSVLHDALLGLQHAHDLKDFDGTPLGVVHRDVSPQNVLVTYDGEVKVLDFGIAKANRQTEQTAIGVIKGKFRYMAPEQVNGSPIDARTDVFAAGIILWEALTERRLWGGLSNPKLLQKVMEGNVPPPRSVVPDVPELLEKVCLRATATQSQDRYHSAQEMALELANAARALGLPTGREFLASYLDAHFREARRAVRAQVESELADATFQEEDQGGSAPWKTGTGSVSIAPELTEEALPNDSLGGSTVPVPVQADEAPATATEDEPGAEARNESESGGLFIGGLLGFLVCVVAFLAWNRYGAEPTQPLTVPSLSSKPVGSSEREQSTSVTHPAASAPPGLPAPEAADTAASQSGELVPPPSSASALKSVGAPRSIRKPSGAVQSPTTSNRPPEAPSAAAAPPPACAVPFELTPDGLKRFKPECLPR
jgi:serine/threonine-protein kinase